MKRILTLLLLVVSACGCSRREVSLRVMTYNTYSGRNAGMEAIAEAIRSNDPDLVALQEVERFTAINPGDTPALLAGMTGMRYALFVHALDIRSGGDYGNVILSKYPFLEQRTFRLGIPGRDYMRSWGYVRIEKEGRAVCFATTHLDHRRDDSLRRVQVGAILQVVDGLDVPVILGGDMNARPEESPVRMLCERFTPGFAAAGTAGPAPTTDDDGGKTIDYLLYAPAEAFGVESYRVDTVAAGVSDHYPVVAEFRLK